MLEVISAAVRWFQLAANLILLGSCVFLVFAGGAKRIYSAEWVEKLERLFPKLAVSIVIGLIIILAATIAHITNDAHKLLIPQVWLEFIGETRAGQIWFGHVIAAVLVAFFVFYLRKSIKTRGRYLLCAILATLPLIADAMSSHSASDGLSITNVMPYALHIIFAGVWLGGLPALLLLKYEYVKQVKTRKASFVDSYILKRFSAMALPVMLFIILTGVIVSDRVFDGFYAALVATPYGLLLSVKVVLLCAILIIASRIRSYWLPMFSNSNDRYEIQESAQGMQKWVRLEFFLAMLLVLIATIIANNLTPGKHALIEVWPFPIRFSYASTWKDENAAVLIWSGFAIVVVALVTLYVGRNAHWNLKRLITIPVMLIILGLSIALPPMAMQAYPETYLKPSVPYDAISITYGADLFAEHCVDCHGYQGKGNGIKARTLSTLVPDMLTEPHIVEHTPGDFYYWISNGIVDTDMPGYENQLQEEDRWDLVNYVYALSRGYQARILSPEILPNRKTIQPPFFAYTTHDGESGVLQDFRGKQSIMLVIFSWPDSRERLKLLQQNVTKFKAQDVALLAVPTKPLAPDELDEVIRIISYPIVVQGDQEIVKSYALLRRTMNRPDMLGRGSIPGHMEFLIDRDSFLRARWIPVAEAEGWKNMRLLERQIELLNKENTGRITANEYVN